MRQREGGDDLHDVNERRAKRRHRRPARGAPQQHRRQEQGEQKEDVVKADPDVPHALTHIGRELRQAAGGLQREALRAGGGLQHGGLRGCASVQLQEPTVQRVELGEERVAKVQRAWRLCAGQAEAQHGVGAVTVLVDELLTCAGAAGLARALHRQPRQGVGGDVGVARAQLAPGDVAVAVGVQADSVVEVAQGDVPLALNDGALVER